MVKQAEKELGSFDCVHVEPGKSTPSVGKLSVYKTSLVFKARMFGLDDTNISVKRRDLDSVDATSPLTLKMTYKETKSLDLQFTKSTIPYRCVVDNWRLCETERDAFAVNERAANKKEAREYPAGVSGRRDAPRSTSRSPTRRSTRRSNQRFRMPVDSARAFLPRRVFPPSTARRL